MCSGSGEEDNSDEDETGVIRVVLHQKESPGVLGKNKSCTWNSELPLRLNQDVQRESDVKRMKLLMENLRLNKNTENGGGGGGGVDVRDHVPESGIFTRIESKYKLACASQFQTTNNNLNNVSTKKGKLSDR